MHVVVADFSVVVGERAHRSYDNALHSTFSTIRTQKLDYALPNKHTYMELCVYMRNVNRNINVICINKSYSSVTSLRGLCVVPGGVNDETAGLPVSVAN